MEDSWRQAIIIIGHSNDIFLAFHSAWLVSLNVVRMFVVFVGPNNELSNASFVNHP